ncbi:MAG: diversity-generating retroelement protein Avd [Ardenticatenia bacterium]|nr:diversity-generating retroelement protein Avd [Ardenticatenia bacterium]
MSDDAVADQMVIFTRSFDLLAWLLPKSDKFPKEQRFTVTQRLQAAVLDLVESLHLANARSGPSRLRHLEAADAHLDKLRMYLRLSHQWHWLSDGQYKHVSTMVAEVGRLLGGWKRQTAGR